MAPSDYESLGVFLICNSRSLSFMGSVDPAKYVSFCLQDRNRYTNELNDVGKSCRGYIIFPVCDERPLFEIVSLMSCSQGMINNQFIQSILPIKSRHCF